MKKVDLGHGVYTHSGTIDLDLVCVHGRIGHQDLGILNPFGLAYSYPLVQNEALVQEGLLQASFLSGAGLTGHNAKQQCWHVGAVLFVVME